MTLVKWTPRRNYLTPFREFDTLFDNMLSLGLGNNLFASENSWLPAVDVIEGEKEYTIRVETPGMEKKDLNITVQDGVLTISGEKKSDKEEKEDQYYCKEASYGKFTRSFRLQEDVQEKKVKANYKNGVLTLTIPRVKPVKPEKIEVSIN